MIDGEAILAAVLSLHEATELSFKRVEARFDGVDRRNESLESKVDALQTRLDRFETKVLQRFDALDVRLAAVERPSS